MTIQIEYAAKITMQNYAAERIRNLHVALERQNDVSEAQMIRGQIKELRALEAQLSDPKPGHEPRAAVSYG